MAQRERKEATSAIVKLSEKYGLSEVEMLETLKATVIRPKKIKGRDGKPDSFVPATTAEVNAFMAVSSRYELDPLLKQIHAFVGKEGGIVPIVGYDGWVALVNRQKRFAGFECVDHIDERGQLYAITGKMHVWVDEPGGEKYTVEVTEYLDECRMDTEPWRKWPRRMLRNKVYNQTARVAFGLSGLYDEDEAERIRVAEEAAIDVTPIKAPQALPSKVPPPGAHKSPGSTAGTGSAGPSRGQETTSGAAPPSTPPATGTPPTGDPGPKTDAQKREYILAVATKAAGEYGIEVSQVVYDLSKFTSTKEGEQGKEIGRTDVNTLDGRWLNKTYGQAREMAKQIGFGEGVDGNDDDVPF